MLADTPAEHVVIMLGPRGEVATWNEIAEDVFGWKPAEILGRSTDVLYERSAAERRAALRQITAALSCDSVERTSRLRRKDGALFQAVTTVTALKDARGKLRGELLLVENAAGGVRDTPRLLDTDRLLRTADVGVTVQAVDGRLVYANETAARLCGCKSTADLLSSPLSAILSRFALLSEDGAEFPPERLPGRRVLAGEDAEPVLIQVRERATGRRWWSHLFAKAVQSPSGKPTLAINVWFDVTDEQRRKEGMQHLLELTASLMTVFDYQTRLERLADDLVPRLADWCAIQLLEDGVRQPLVARGADRYKVEELKRLAETANVVARASSPPPRLVPNVCDEDLDTLAGGSSGATLLKELGIRSAIIVPIPAKGRATGALVLATADSGRTYDKRDLDLARELAQRTSVLLEHARSYRAAQEAVRMRDDFLSVAAHELRTPLASLSLLLETLRESTQGEVAHRIDMGIRQARRMGALVDALLDVSRLTSGHLVLDFTRQDVAQIVREAAARFFPEAETSHSKILLCCEGECMAEIDRLRIDQVVSNLISNALKYGRGHPVDVCCGVRDGDVHIEVRDRGIGIAPHDRDRVFRRFERAVGDRNYPGLGIGLWIVREIVAAHGGNIDIRGELGKGAIFDVALPIVRGRDLRS